MKWLLVIASLALLFTLPSLIADGKPVEWAMFIMAAFAMLMVIGKHQYEQENDEDAQLGK
ncbi:MAG: hypothetical protein AB7E49_01445 [Campylobacterales bacterium]